jgi:hypothetical protein
MFHKRKFTPFNPQKYTGDPTNIIMRSSWETKFAIWCDRNPAVVKWNSEETIVPYVCPTDNKWHRYFIDFKIQIRDKQGVLKTYLVEIKPDKQTRPPEIPNRKTKRFLIEAATYMKNEAKWKAAKQFALDRGWEFIILTEHHLGTNK